jgi:uncharacterized protein YbjT (DUF2867 family)
MILKKSENGMKAVIAGASGLVGSCLLDMLIKDRYYDEIGVLTRRSLNRDVSMIREIITDFGNLKESLKDVKADHVFCCLGTTLKKAGSKENFRKVDFEYPLELAEVMYSKKAQKYLLVSALGANKKSIIFYNRVKGEVEEALTNIDYHSLYIFRPSILLGDRDEKRPVEDIAKKVYKYLDPFFLGPLKKYKSIHASSVAASMMMMAKTGPEGKVILESDQIKSQPGPER